MPPAVFVICKAMFNFICMFSIFMAMFTFIIYVFSISIVMKPRSGAPARHTILYTLLIPY